jgi:hypothetical protein
VVEILRRELQEEELVGKGEGVEIQQQEEIVGQKEELGQLAVGDERDLIAIDGIDNPKDKEATKTLQPRNSRLRSTIFDFVGSAPGSLRDARQRQPSTESYGVNNQTGMIPGSAKTICGYQYYGRLMNDPLEAWPHK